MVKLNAHYNKLKLGKWNLKHLSSLEPGPFHAPLIDLTAAEPAEPLAPAVISAFTKSCQEMERSPMEGLLSLREAISKEDYVGKIAPDEIFISDTPDIGAAQIQEIFCISNRIAVPDPSHPACINMAVLAGRSRTQLKSGRYGGIVYLPCVEENRFCPHPPREMCDLIYLSSPMHPTGSVLEKELLEQWVAYAKKTQAVILFESSCHLYVQSEKAAQSIYEIEGAKEVAIELRSYAKIPGASALGLSYITIPKTLKIFDCGKDSFLHALWQKRQKASGSIPSYPIQKAIEAIYSPEGKQQIEQKIQAFRENGAVLRKALQDLGLKVYGGIDAPYLWCKIPDENLSSQQFFKWLLERSGVLCTPGNDFGLLGEKFVHFSALAPKKKLLEATHRLQGCL